jgi:MOSC domain-containing protein YiiM
LALNRMAKVISVNVGLPREIESGGRMVRTGIFKQPVEGSVRIRDVNLDGDRQADLTVHGGPAKAVYAYPAEHYPFWHGELPDTPLPWGSFGENLTVEGLPLEHQIGIGDRLRIGTAELVVTQPRLPCFKLGIRFGRADIVKRFLDAGRTGYYFAVAVPGEVAAGDEAEVIDTDPARFTIAELTAVYANGRSDEPALRRLLTLAALPEEWRRWAANRLAVTADRSGA